MKITKFFQISVSTLFVFLIVRNIDLSEANYYFKQIELLQFVYLFILISIVLIFNFYKWQEISDKNKKIKKVNFKVYLKSRFFNVLGLGSTFGDIYKFFRLRKVFTVAELSGFIIVDRLIGLVVMFYLLICSSLIQLKINYSFIKNYFWIMPFLIAIILIFHFRVKLLNLTYKYLNWNQKNKIKPLVEIINKKHYLATLYGVFGTLIWFFSFYVILKCLALDISFVEVIFICSITEIIRSVPVSFNGIGIREYIFAYFLLKIGYSYELGIIASSLVYIILTIESLICFPISLFVKDEKN